MRWGGMATRLISDLNPCVVDDLGARPKDGASVGGATSGPSRTTSIKIASSGGCLVGLSDVGATSMASPPATRRAFFFDSERRFLRGALEELGTDGRTTMRVFGEIQALGKARLGPHVLTLLQRGRTLRCAKWLLTLQKI